VFSTYTRHCSPIRYDKQLVWDVLSFLQINILQIIFIAWKIGNIIGYFFMDIVGMHTLKDEFNVDGV